MKIKINVMVLAFAVTFAMSAQAAGAKTSAKTGNKQYKEGEVVVRLKQATGTLNAFAAHNLLSDLSSKYDVTISPLMTDDSIVTVYSSSGDINELMAWVAQNPNVDVVEPNWIYRIIANDEDRNAPNDPKFEQNWGLYNFGQRDSKGQVGIAGSDISATQAWKLATGSKDILVAVIDTGVDYRHEDLKDNAWVNAKEIPDNEIDDDDNGFVDDVYGYNFSGKTGDPMDDNKHGTHTSGTIGAKGNNGIGTAGVNWDVRIMGVKFLSAQGSGTSKDAIDAIKYATKMGAKVMSNSWGGGGYSQLMFDAIKAAKDKGALFVAAAGNSSSDNDTKATYPASYKLDNVIAVAASDNRDQIASFSNWGQKTVHLSAPGVNVLSTVPASKGGYGTFSGTSMACPHVAGAAALVWSVNPTAGFATVKNVLLSNVDKIAGFKGNTVSGGRLNVLNALKGMIALKRKD